MSSSPNDEEAETGSQSQRKLHGDRGERGSAPGGVVEAQRDQGDFQGEAGEVAPAEQKAAEKTYEDFSKQYKDLFARANQYTLEQAGSQVYTEEMPELHVVAAGSLLDFAIESLGRSTEERTSATRERAVAQA